MVDISRAVLLRSRLNDLFQQIRYCEQVIDDFSHYENESKTKSRRNPKEDAIVRKADYLTEFENVQKELNEAMMLITLRINSLECRAEVRRATYMFFVQGYSLERIGQEMHYSKTQVFRLKEEGRIHYEGRNNRC